MKTGQLTNKQLMIIAGVAIAAIVLVAAFRSKKTEPTSQPVPPVMETATPTSPDAEAPSAPSAPGAAPAPQPAPAPAPSTQKEAPSATLSYSQALTTYAGRRMQFDSRCQADPTQFVFKNPATMMLDNRASVSKTITVGSNAYTIAPYGFRIITVSSSKLPATLSVDCGTAQNVAKVVLQK